MKEVYYYQIFGMTVKSDRYFEEAIQLEVQSRVDVTVIETSIDDALMPQEGDPAGGTSYTKSANWMCSAYKTIGTFIIENGKRINYRLVDHHDVKYVDRFILCFVFVYIFRQRGIIGIHGSCLNYKGKALIISGDSGAGKSSLTSAMIDSGHKYLSDDIVAVENSNGSFIANASYPWRKLDESSLIEHGLSPEDYHLVPDEHKVKYSIIDKDHYDGGHLGLGSMMILEPSDVNSVTIEEIQGIKKIEYIRKNLYGTILTNVVEYSRKELEMILSLSNQINIYLLKRPYKGRTVNSQMEIIYKTLE